MRVTWSGPVPSVVADDGFDPMCASSSRGASAFAEARSDHGEGECEQGDQRKSHEQLRAG
jgi:hypothetical protein